MQLFGEKGYESTSVADILKAAGANSGSLYHFFPTKQDLLLEVLRRYRDGIGPMLLAPAWEGHGRIPSSGCSRCSPPIAARWPAANASMAAPSAAWRWRCTSPIRRCAN
jgi:AcrR family transcriptional regulator